MGTSSGDSSNMWIPLLDGLYYCYTLVIHQPILQTSQTLFYHRLLTSPIFKDILILFHIIYLIEANCYPFNKYLPKDLYWARHHSRFKTYKQNKNPVLMEIGAKS